MTTRLPIVVGVAAVMMLSACGGASDDASSSAPGTVSDSVPASAETSVSDPPISSPSQASTTVAATTATTQPGPPTELVDLPDIMEIVVTTPPSGNGERPLFAWEPMDAAASYSLVLSGSDGQAYWAWSGGESQIWLGGSADEPSAEASGPYMVEPMTLRVFASDADGVIVGAGQPVVITP